MKTSGLVSLLVFLGTVQVSFAVELEYANYFYDGGLGTQQQPYQIRTAPQLISLANRTGDYGKYFILTADIDLSDYVLATALIAPDNDPDAQYLQGTPFTGSFNGDGHKITGLTIDASETNNSFLGLFGQLNAPGIIKDLGVENVSITAGNNTQLLGSVVGYTNIGGTISNCYATGSVTAGTNSIYLGGLTGASNGHIDNCYAMVNVSGGTYSNCLGGLTGYNAPAAPGNINNCYSTGMVIGGSGVGGLCGMNEEGIITNSHSTGTVICNDGYTYNYTYIGYTGGLCGQNNGGSITDCYSTATVVGYDRIAGLCGQNNSGCITNCYSTGLVIGDDYIGGLCGENSYSGNITGCYATATVDGKNQIGGLCGQNYGSISDSYTAATVIGDGEDIGGLCGSNYYSGSIIGCYSTSTVTGDINVGGLCGDNSGNITSCYATATVIGGYNVGGLCGANGATDNSPNVSNDCTGYITNCYSCGTVNSTGSGGGIRASIAGGLCGQNCGSITNCYSTATVTGSYNSTGGLCGNSYYGYGTITGCYFLDTAGPDNGLGDPLTDAQMRQQSSFIGWDFVVTWEMPDGGGYPVLSWRDPYDDGDGSAATPYQIRTTSQLLYLAGHPTDYNKYFILTADIDLSSYTFTTALIAPDIDPAVQYLQGTPFTGSFDGQGHKIINLNINTGGPGNDYLGLFGQLNSTGLVQNLGVENVSVTVGDNTQLLGALVGYANTGSIISNCYATGSVSAGANTIYLGGLIGANNGHIDNCYAMTTVSGGTNCDYVGGLVGRNAPAAPGHIDNGYSTGAVSAGAGSSDVGGLSGNNAGSVTDSFWDTDSSGQTTSGGGEGKTTAQMQDINTFLAANWDFENLWHMPYQSTGYPMLFWQRDIPGDFTAGYGVTLADFAIFSQSWLTSSGQPGYNEDCDLVDDDTINLADLAIFAENFLQGL